MKTRVAETLAGWFGLDVPVPEYGFFLSLSLLLAIIWANRTLKRFGIKEEARYVLFSSAVLGVYLGAKSLYLVQYPEEAGDILQEPLGFLRVGYSLYGGLFGLLAAVWCVSRRWSIPLLAILDAMTPPMALGLAITRLGCFISGCNFGWPTALPWGVRFPAGSPAWSQHVKEGMLSPEAPFSLPVHPTQLYELALGLALCFAGLALRSRFRFGTGRLFLTMLGAYAFFRGVEESLRADAGGVSFGPFTFAQVVSISIMAITVLLGTRTAAGLVSEPVRARLRPRHPGVARLE
jgi:phosphatidylglycerol:prolipoprotein diacylglycerol transferase